VVLLVALALLAALADTTKLGPGSWVASAVVVYMAQQSGGLLRPALSLGRTAAAIVVVSIRGDGSVTTRQAIVRPAVRLLAVLTALGAAGATEYHWLACIPLVIELALIAHTSWRQSVADLLAGTLVVNMPQPQPHRAPAVPMYSATDAEFGPPPRGGSHKQSPRGAALP
jgi:uncharacterized RDD family membrane protein YckC